MGFLAALSGVLLTAAPSGGLGLGLFAGANPDWPAGDPALAGEALARPEAHPDDPLFAPWARGGTCTGQAPLYGFTPSCAGGGDPRAPLGASVDRAWLLTVGAPEVTIAILSDGVDLAEPRLASAIRLNPMELPGSPDRNGDGVLTVLDFTSATSTEAPSVDRVVDPRLLARPDRGDVDGDGRLSPRDLLEVFADGVDDDQNGLTDDIAGWDLLEGDNDPGPAAGDDRGTRAALAAAEPGNDGVGGLGACPRCTLLPLRVGAGELAGPPALVRALDLAVAGGAAVVAVAVAVPGDTPELERARARVDAAGVLGIVEAGPGPAGSLVEEAPLSSPGFLLVDALGFEGEGLGARSGPLPCRRGSLELDAVLSGSSCAHAAPAGRVAGIAGLLVDAGRRGAGDRPPPPTPPTPAALAGALVEAARGDPEVGRSPRLGRGRIDARDALERVLEGRAAPRPRWRSPTAGAVLDPTPGSLRVVAEVGDASESEWSWSIGLGEGLAPEGFETVASGGPVGPGPARVDALVPLAGLVRDPVAVPATLEDGAFTLRLTASTRRGGRTLTSRHDRVIFLRTDLDLLPGFPLALGAGCWAGPRIVDGDGDGVPEVWVGLLDGRLMAVSGRGEILRALPARPSGGGSSAGIPYLGAPAARWTGAALEVAAVAADGVLVRATGSVTSPLGRPASATPAAPAGHVAVPAAVAEGGSSVFAWPGRDGVLRARSDGRAETWLELPEVPSPLAVSADRPAVAWARAGSRLVSTDGRSFEVGPPPAARGLARLRPAAPVLSELGDRGAGPMVITRAGLAFVDGTTLARFDEAYLGRALSADGARALGWRSAPGLPLRPVAIPAPALALDDAIVLDGSGAEIAIVDVDGGRPELLFGGDAGRLFALSENGRFAAGWPKATGRPVMGTPVAADIDGDGRVEVAAVTRDGRLFVWRTRGRAADARWAGERHDPGASGRSSVRVEDGVGPGEEDGCRCLRVRPSWVGALVLALAEAGLRRRGSGAGARRGGRARP